MAIKELPKGIVDAHCHIHPRRKAQDTGGDGAGDEADLTAMADRFAIEAMWVSPIFGGYSPGADQVAAGNDAIAAFAGAEPRVRPFARIDPLQGGAAMDELARCIEELGCVGVKVWIAPADDRRMDPLMERMLAYGRPVLIHALDKAVGQVPLESRPPQVAELARRFPEAAMIMAHMGGDFIRGCDAIADVPNVLTDPSGSYCETGMMEYAVDVLGADRILFGSDAPGASFINNVAKVLAADLTDQDTSKILGANARRLIP